MSTETIIISLLTMANVFQLCYWSLLTQRLVNKLMSRNFAEYNAIVNPPEAKEIKSFDEYENDLEEKELLEELNGIIRTS